MFSTPVVLMLDNHPIGRGTVHALKGENGRGHGSEPGAYFIGLPSVLRGKLHEYTTDISVVCQAFGAMKWPDRDVGTALDDKQDAASH
jgi:hypothetical protein